ncbi:MAG: DMT family transporter [Bacillota bacterium]|nr:DMT family transporter [Bacillota bacterium]
MSKRGYIYAVASAILFGTAGMFIKSILSIGLDSVQILTIQYIIAVIIMFSVISILNKDQLKVSKKQIMHLAVLGVLGNTFMTIFYYMAFKYLPVAVVTMLLYTYPIIIFIYTLIFKREGFHYKGIAAVLMAFTGCFLVLNINVNSSEYSIAGMIFAFLAAVFYAFMNLYSERTLSNIPAIVTNAYSTLFSLFSLVLYSPPIFLFHSNINPKSLVYIAALAVFCEIIPLTLLYSSLKYLGSMKVSVIGNLELPTSMMMGYIMLGEKIGLIQVLGAIIIVYAAYLVKK